MKKGKGLLGFIIGVAVTVFVSKNKWCQEKIQKAKEKGEEILNKKCKCQKEESAEETAE